MQDEKVLQSKKVKLVDTKSGPSAIRTDRTEVRWCSSAGISGSRSFRGVVQLTPLGLRVALVVSVLPSTWKTHWNWPDRVGRLSIVRDRVRAVVR